MRNLLKSTFLGIIFFISSFISAEFLSVSTVAEAKKLDSGDSIYFAGELTLQYVAQTSMGIDYYAFDSNNEYVRLRSYYWADIFGTENQLYAGNNIKIGGKLAFFNDDNSCVTFDIPQMSIPTISVVGQGDRHAPIVVTIAELKADTARQYNAKFVSIEGAIVESFLDFTISPFPVNDIVVGTDRIPFTMEGIMTDFPAKANIIGYVDYANGEPKLYIPQFEGFVEPVAFNNISGMKNFRGQLGYEDVEFTANVLVTDVQTSDTAYLYRVQKHDASGNPSALQMIVPKSLNLVYQVGDSVSFSVKGFYVSAIYGENVGVLDNMTSAVFEVESNIATTLISQNNPILVAPYTSLIVVDVEEYWTKYDNCLVATLKGEVITSDELSAIGCIALRLMNSAYGCYDTVLVANTYYAEVGSPTEAIVCGFIGGYQYGEEYYTALIPRSKYDFLSDFMEFDNIAAMKSAGSTPSRDISYKLNSPMAITGFSSVTDNGYTVYMIFVQDSTGYIQLNHNSKKLQNELKIGDVITGATGFYTGNTGVSYYSEDFGYVFATAPALEVDDSSIILSDKQYVAQPVEITLAELNDSYASQLITIKDVNYKKETIILSTEDKYLPIIYSGDDWAIVSGDYTYSSEISSITGVYFLYSKLTEIIPRNQNDIINATMVDVENLVDDKNLFVQNDVVYAEGAMIEVYDIMGRLVISADNLVDLSAFDETFVIVKTIYDNDAQFVTKLVVR